MNPFFETPIIEPRGGLSIQRLSKAEIAFIKEAYTFLEKDSLVVKLSRLVGKPIEAAQQSLPPKVQDLVNKSAQDSLIFSLKTVLKTLPQKNQDVVNFVSTSKKTKSFHTVLAGLSGGIGGFFGAIALPIELPTSTCIILRSITKIAKECGEDFSDPKTLLECVAIFSYGDHNLGRENPDFNSMYFAQRLAYSKLINDAAKYIAAHSAPSLLLAKKDLAPALVSFIAKIASIFKISVSKKIFAESIPIIGSLGGTAINSLFSEHYSNVARYHFGIRSMERKYGKNRIQTIYENMQHTQKNDIS